MSDERKGLAKVNPSEPYIQVAHVDNPFRRRVDRFDTVEWRRGMTVAEVVAQCLAARRRPAGRATGHCIPLVDMAPALDSGRSTTWEVVEPSPSRALVPDPRPPIRVTVSMNGEIIPEGHWGRRNVMPGDQLVIVPSITGGGGGKAILRMVLMVVVAVVSIYTGGVVGGLLGKVVTAAILIGGGMLLNALLPGSSSDDNLESSTYTWNPSNTSSQGVVIARWYGTHRVYGNVLASYIDREDDKEYLNAIVSVGYGPVSAFGTFRINDQKSSFFDEVTIETRLGHVHQAVFSNFTSTKTEDAMEVQITKDDPYIYTTIGSDFDGFEVDITCPSGLIAYEDGEYTETSVTITIEYRLQGEETWLTNGVHTITAKKTTAVRRTYKQLVTNQGKYEIRITRNTEDHVGSTTITDDSYLTTVREYYVDQFQYPRQAMYCFRALATSQLSNSVEISVQLDGAIVNVYDGENWSLQFSNNLAWVAWDILTQPVIGGSGTTEDPYYIIRFDGMDPIRLDLPKFLEWANSCDELVPDGLGGTEKRITFNGGFDSNTTMWEALLRVCEIGRAVPIWRGINLSVAIDKPADPVFLFTVGNIEESSFRETFLSQEERATEVECNFTNKQNNYERDKLVVYRNDVDCSQYKATLDCFGLVKPTEVWRAGKYRLNCNRRLLRTIEIAVDIEALAATIGDVGYIQHDVPRWSEGGRIYNASLYSVTLDKKVTIEEGKSYKLLIRLDDDNLMERIVTNEAGETDVITVAPALNTRFDDESGWYSSNYPHRQKVTIKHTKVAGAVQNFPFAIQITDPDNPIFSRALANGYDILVTSDDGETKIPYERSVWDPVNHKLLLYAQIPALSPSADGTIYIYYGYEACTTDQQNKTGVWDANFMFVYHMEENPAEDYIRDSTSTGLDLNYEGTLHLEDLVASPIGNGWRFHGLNPCLEWGAEWSALSQFTIESVLKCEYEGNALEVGWLNIKNADFEISCDVHSMGNGYLSDYLHNGICVRVGVVPGTMYIGPVVTSYEVNEFRHITHAGTESVDYKTYVDGVEASLKSLSGTTFGTFTGGAWRVKVGSGGTFYTGILSEIRFSKTERSAAWVKTTAENLLNNDSTWSIAAEESLEIVAASVKKYDLWMLGEAEKIRNLYRIIGIRKTHDQKCTLSLINYDERVYEGDNQTPAFGASTQDSLEEMQPTGATLSEDISSSPTGSEVASILISFTKSTDPNYRGCQVWYKLAYETTSGAWRQVQFTTGESAVVSGVTRGETYGIALLPVNTDGGVLPIYKAAVYEITISIQSSQWVLDENGDWAFNG